MIEATIKAVDAPEALASGAVPLVVQLERELVRLADDVERHTEASRTLAADSIVEKAKADAAALRASFVIRRFIEAAGHSTDTHSVKVERGKVSIVEIEEPKP